MLSKKKNEKFLYFRYLELLSQGSSGITPEKNDPVANIRWKLYCFERGNSVSSGPSDCISPKQKFN